MTITAHAIHRFQDRFERCSYDAARWGIEAMIDEARGLNLSEVLTLREAGAMVSRPPVPVPRLQRNALGYQVRS